MRHQITKIGLIAVVDLFAVIGVTLATITTSISDAQAQLHHHCRLPNGNPFPGNEPHGCPPGLDKRNE